MYLDKPEGQPDDKVAWASDVAAQMLRRLGFKYVSLNPGASYRGLHDSIVNHLGNVDPGMLLCLHEDHAVGVAHGYAKATGKPMAAIVHSNVGLMHGMMAIWNAFCDRMPVYILGATGPVDSHQRRPWIDWIHTSADQGGLVRDIVKFDNQPSSPEATIDAMLRANLMMRTEPCAPTYICLDAGMQEAPLDREVPLPPIERYQAPKPPAVMEDVLEVVHTMLSNAKRPIILAGRVSRSLDAWKHRVELAEAYGATVLSSANSAPAFPVDHPLHSLPPVGDKPSDEESKLLAEADVLLSLDWVDLAGFIRSRTGKAQTLEPLAAKMINCSMESLLANGWSMDHQALPAADIVVQTHPDTLTAQLLKRAGAAKKAIAHPEHWTKRPRPQSKSGAFDLRALAYALADWTDGKDVTVARTPIGWPSDACMFRHPLDYLGKDGGGAVGTGPAHTVGAALALKGSGRMVIGVVGDGDCAMGMNALWTASNQNLPMMLIVANNQSYFNDEVHQERMAIQRRRPVENKHIGQRLDSPAIEHTQIAMGQGFDAHAPVRNVDELKQALAEGERIVRAGGRYMIDARIIPGYAG